METENDKKQKQNIKEKKRVKRFKEKMKYDFKKKEK